MKQTTTKLPAGTIRRININGLSGRVLTIPKAKNGNKKSKDVEILLVYGMHSSLERWYTLAKALTQFGNVTMPDLPGHGGMDSFYRIKMEPTLDNFADYLATFIKLHYKNKRFIILGMSLGFEIVTDLLARYPDITQNTDLVVSGVGFTHHRDFKIKRSNQAVLKVIGYIISRRALGYLTQHLIFNRFFVSLGFRIWGRKHLKKYIGLTKEQIREYSQIDIDLWRINDVRTRGYTAYKMFISDLTYLHVPLAVHHIHVPDDQYFYRDRVKQHMSMIYTGYHEYLANFVSHGSPLIATESEAMSMFNQELQKHIRSIGKTTKKTRQK